MKIYNDSNESKMKISECKCKIPDKPWLISFTTGSLNRRDEFRICDFCEKNNPVFNRFRISVKRINEKTWDVSK